MDTSLLTDTLFDVVYAELPPSMSDEEAEGVARRQVVAVLRELAAAGEKAGGEVSAAELTGYADVIDLGVAS